MKYLITIEVMGEVETFDFNSRELRDAFARDLQLEAGTVDFMVLDVPDVERDDEH